MIGLNTSHDRIFLSENWGISEHIPQFSTLRVAKKIWRIINTSENMLGYLSLICSSKLKVFLELRSQKIVRFPEQIMLQTNMLAYFHANVLKLYCSYMIYWSWSNLCSAVKKTCAKSRQMLTVVKSQYANLVEKIPAGQYYRSVLTA